MSPTLPFGVKGIARVNSFGRVYGQGKSDDYGSWPFHTEHLFFVNLSFHVELKEQIIGTVILYVIWFSMNIALDESFYNILAISSLQTTATQPWSNQKWCLSPFCMNEEHHQSSKTRWHHEQESLECSKVYTTKSYAWKNEAGIHLMEVNQPMQFVSTTREDKKHWLGRDILVNSAR